MGSEGRGLIKACDLSLWPNQPLSVTGEALKQDEWECDLGLGFCLGSVMNELLSGHSPET